MSKRASRWGTAPATDAPSAQEQKVVDESPEAAAERRRKAMAIAQMLSSKLGEPGGITGVKRGREDDTTPDGRQKRKVFVPASSTDTFKDKFARMKGEIEAKSGATLLLQGRGSEVAESDEDLHVVIIGNDQTLNAAEDMVQNMFLGAPPAPSSTSRFSAAPPSSGFSNFGNAPQGVQMPNFAASGPGTRTLEIPNDKVGLVIGRGGESIKNIQAMSGCQVQIAPEPPSWAPTRSVTLTGSPQQMASAEQEIKSICDRANDRGGGGGGGYGGNNNFSGGPGLGFGGDSKTVNIDIPNDMVGLLIGKGGETIRNLQARTGAHIQVTRDADSRPGSTTRAVTISGTSAQVTAAEQQIKATLSNVDGPSQGNKIMIPNHCVGMIIGRGGETIRGLIQKTGARIQISKDDRGDQREVSLQGQQHEVEYAKSEIFALVAEAEGRHGGGGGGGGARGGGGGYGGGPSPYGGPPQQQGWGAPGPYDQQRQGYSPYGNPYGGPHGHPGYGAPQPHHAPAPHPAQQPPAPSTESGPPAASGPDGKKAAGPPNPQTGQDQMAAYTQWAQQYFMSYGQYPPQYDPNYVAQWQQYYAQLQQYQQRTGQQPPAQGQQQPPPSSDQAPPPQQQEQAPPSSEQPPAPTQTPPSEAPPQAASELPPGL